MQRVASVVHLDAARRLHLTGKGVGIAILDTGIGFHPDLTLSDSGLCAFVDTINHRRDFYDDNGHGTHISGIIAGNGSASHGIYEGIAPDCHFVMIKVLNHRGEGNTDHVLAGIQWLLDHYEEYHIRIVNISVGSSRGKHFGENSPLVQGVNRLWSAGMVVLTAAGNHGPNPQSIGAPGNSRKIITVGASDVMQTGTGHDYSGRGPTENCIKKPDIVAPGSHIISCQPFPKTSPLLYGKNYLAIPPDQAYHSRSGTSMSTPVVSGCIALLLQQRPYMTNRDVKIHIKKTAYDLGYDHSRQGWGLIRLDRLLYL
jgi:serine protease AprX